MPTMTRAMITMTSRTMKNPRTPMRTLFDKSSGLTPPTSGQKQSFSVTVGENASSRAIEGREEGK